MRLGFNISNWNAWVSGLEYPDALVDRSRHNRTGNLGPAIPDVSYMPAMLRRRLSPLARTALHVAWQCLGDARQTPTIFSSVYGESDRTFELTRAIASEQPVSPAAFSLSVHNAISGQFTIARQITVETTCLSPVGGSVLPALMEAQGLLQTERHNQALVVFYDQQLPLVYRATKPGPSGLTACALLITRAASDSYFSLQRIASAPGGADEQEAQLKGLIRVLQGRDDNICLQGMGSLWRWERCCAQA